MASKKLMAFWAFTDLWLFAAAVLSITMSVVWGLPSASMMIKFTLNSHFLLGAWP